MKRKEKGITLIALVITIIVMLILVGVTVNVAINGELFSKAGKATTETQYEADRESLLASAIGAMNNDAEVDFEKLGKNLPEGFTKKDDGWYTSKAGNQFIVTADGSVKEWYNLTDKEMNHIRSDRNNIGYFNEHCFAYAVASIGTRTTTWELGFCFDDSFTVTAIVFQPKDFPENPSSCRILLLNRPGVFERI